MLADRLKMTVGQMMASMSQEEYVQWQALYAVEAREAEHAAKVQRSRRR